MILIVCEGNVCRSPVAVALLRDALAGRDIEVTSAGTHALVGASVEPAMVEVARRIGIDVDGHRGRQLTADLVARSGFVLTASRKIRRELVELAPAAVQRSFTIRQFGRIMAAADEQFRPQGSLDMQLSALSAYASRHRSSPPPPDPTADDVSDPHRRPLRAHELAVAQMVQGLDALALALGGPPVRRQQET